jgi:hypothetical protein
LIGKPTASAGTSASSAHDEENDAGHHGHVIARHKSTKNLNVVYQRLTDHSLPTIQDREANGTLRQAIVLPLYIAALTVLLVVVCCGFLWPVWSEDARKRQVALAGALLGDD